MTFMLQRRLFQNFIFKLNQKLADQEKIKLFCKHVNTYNVIPNACKPIIAIANMPFYRKLACICVIKKIFKCFFNKLNRDICKLKSFASFAQNSPRKTNLQQSYFSFPRVDPKKSSLF